MIKPVKILLFTISITLIYSQVSFAQIAENALKFSEMGSFGTARIQAIGGAGYALGGDVSTAAINPAGLGFFNRSTIVFTPTFSYTDITANYLDQQNDLFNTNLGISNFGIVFNNTKEDELIPSDWRGGSFSITYNRINRHNFDYIFDPTINEFSILDEFALQSNGISADVLENNVSNENFLSYADAAYYNYLINPDASGSNYFVSIPEGTLADQDGYVEEQSRLSQWNFAYGGNFKDKLYLGASLGFKSFSYERTNEFNEYYLYPDDYIVYQGGYFFPVPDGDVSIDSVTFNRLSEVQRIDGTGINVNLGVIYRPVNEITIGLSYQSPTFYSVTEDYQFDLESDVYGIQISDTEAPFDIEGPDDLVRGTPILSEYTLATPSRIGAGLAYFFQKYGFITADIEYVNFKRSRFNASNFATSYLNDEVDQYFRSSINYKVGGEFRYDVFRLRLGYAMYADPTQFPNDDLDRDRQILSGGVGISTAKFFADLAITYTQYETDYRPYTYASYFPLSSTTQQNNITQASLTLGFNF